jgi:hypothetical protein
MGLKCHDAAVDSTEDFRLAPTILLPELIGQSTPSLRTGLVVTLTSALSLVKLRWAATTFVVCLQIGQITGHERRRSGRRIDGYAGVH